MNYATDADLLAWEPAVFAEGFASQTLLSGTGDLAGTTFTLDAGSLLDAHVQPGQVIWLAGTTNAGFVVVSVDSATQLTLSVLHEGLDDDPPAPGPVGTAIDVPFAVRTFHAQRKGVADELLRRLAVSDPTTITNPEALKLPVILGALWRVHLAKVAAAPAESAPELLSRAELYRALYERAARRVVVRVDSDLDGIAEAVRDLGTITLARS